MSKLVISASYRDRTASSYHRRAPTMTAANGQPPVELDWRAYCARYLPGRRPRHDLEAVVAYGAYRSSGVRKPA